jgi:hypothetical protein
MCWWKKVNTNLSESNNYIIQHIIDNNNITGIILLLIASLLIKRNFNSVLTIPKIFENSNTDSWNVFINKWAVIIILLIFGLFPLFKY